MTVVIHGHDYGRVRDWKLVADSEIVTYSMSVSTALDFLRYKSFHILSLFRSLF
jgi:hypothetical protein